MVEIAGIRSGAFWLRCATRMRHFGEFWGCFKMLKVSKMSEKLECNHFNVSFLTTSVAFQAKVVRKCIMFVSIFWQKCAVVIHRWSINLQLFPSYSLYILDHHIDVFEHQMSFFKLEFQSIFHSSFHSIFYPLYTVYWSVSDSFRTFSCSYIFLSLSNFRRKEPWVCMKTLYILCIGSHIWTTYTNHQSINHSNNPKHFEHNQNQITFMRTFHICNESNHCNWFIHITHYGTT